MKSEHINMRVSRAEKRAIELAARRAGVSVTEYMLQSAFMRAAIVTPRKEGAK